MLRPLPSSRRLVFRELARGDLERFHQLATDPHIRRFLLDGQLVSRDWSAAAIAKSGWLFAREGLGLWLLFERAPRGERPERPIGFGFRP